MFPSGWYMVAVSSGLAPGASRVDRALGTEFTVTRGRDGSLTVRDAVGRLRQAHEVNDMVLVWEGDGAPDFTIDPCEELGDRKWTDIRWGRSPVYRTSVVAVQRDVVDNDHFGPVHHLDQAETRAHPRGPFLDTVSQGIINLSRLGGPQLLGHIRLTGRLHGIGLLTYRTTITLGIRLRSLVLSAPTPVDADHVQFHVGVAVRRIFPGASELMRASVLASVLNDIRNDAVLWEAPAGAGESAARLPEQARMFEMFDTWLTQHLPGAVGSGEGAAPP